MDIIRSVLRSEGVSVDNVRVGLILKDTIAFLHRSVACKDDIFSALVTAKDGSPTGYVRLCHNNLLEVMFCKECLLTSFVSTVRALANSQKCRQGIA